MIGGPKLQPNMEARVVVAAYSSSRCRSTNVLVAIVDRVAVYETSPRPCPKGNLDDEWIRLLGTMYTTQGRPPDWLLVDFLFAQRLNRSDSGWYVLVYNPTDESSK